MEARAMNRKIFWGILRLACSLVSPACDGGGTGRDGGDDGDEGGEDFIFPDVDAGDEGGGDPVDGWDSPDAPDADDGADTPDERDCRITIEPCTSAGDRIFFDDFEDEAATQAGWGSTGYAFDTGHLGGRGILVENTEAGTSRVIVHAIPIEAVRGVDVEVTGWVRAEAISEKPDPWNGVKIMMHVSGPGGDDWPQPLVDVGTFDWTQKGFTRAVPDDAESVDLILGLELVTGRVWFDDIEMKVHSCPPDVTFDPGCPVHEGHEVPVLRGAMVSTAATAEDLRVLGRDWNANVIRWQLGGTTATPLDSPDYDTVLQAQTDLLDAALPTCREVGLMVVVDLHGLATGLFDGAAGQGKFIEVWQGLAAKYRDSEVVWGYDLANEPIEVYPPPEGALMWREIAEAAAQAVREIDPETTIIVECPIGGGPSGFEAFYPIDVDRVVYSVHMYRPHVFTHQGVFPEYDTPYVYPGEIEGEVWDRARMEQELQPVIDFAQAYHAQIFVGEFSAIRWAPDNSAYRYLGDAIDIFEAEGWDWTYHAFREWNGWSVEHSETQGDDEPTAVPNDRQNLLRSWFALNVKPF
jgi:endoglucanase